MLAHIIWLWIGCVGFVGCAVGIAIEIAFRRYVPAVLAAVPAGMMLFLIVANAIQLSKDIP